MGGVRGLLFFNLEHDHQRIQDAINQASSERQRVDMMYTMDATMAGGTTFTCGTLCKLP